MKQTFTAHNLLLPSGERTIPESKGIIPLENDPRVDAILNTLKAFDCKDMLDLGCLEGGYSVLAAQAGVKSVGLEARESNYQNCLWLLSQVKLPNLGFIKEDVRTIGDMPQFDSVLCNGLLYHMHNPVELIKDMYKIAKKVVIIHTHYAEEKNNYNLSWLDMHEGYEGRWFHEFDEGISPEEMDKLKWASFGNDRSYWLTKNSLLQALHDVGFSCVYEQAEFDKNGKLNTGWNEMSRGLFIAIK